MTGFILLIIGLVISLATLVVLALIKMGIKTNLDKIQDMSAADLVKFMKLIDDYGVCGCCIHGGECNSLEKQDCDANIKAWLKKEIE